MSNKRVLLVFRRQVMREMARFYRHDFSNENAVKPDLSRKREKWSVSKKANLHSSATKFDFTNDCLLCGRSTSDQRKKGDVSVYQVCTSSCQANLELLCLQRGPGDKWAETLKRPLNMPRICMPLTQSIISSAI
ncbi:hypothetical protein PoB_001291500 [Plakobranchus ocellatus]|uniref:Uncharacterized protein n=1 Tax=Plakobranchus ocellatus TaxID=259542 RepID=A0AAV3YVE2_9GAST|nr:hypothetical protein PoB_001291500 [Plakobranchus ocellatus]